jgi:MOSC domain-containing protein YiiM
MAHHDDESKGLLTHVPTESDRRERSAHHSRSSRDHGVGTLERIWLKRGKGGPMDPVDNARLEVDRGLNGNANRGGKRQVTIISKERWAELMDALGANLPPSARRANLMVSGIDLENSRGRVLRVGGTRLKINGETRPCEQMEAAHAGLEELMRERWAGGAFAEVLEGGEIRVGDAVIFESLITDHSSRIGTVRRPR